MGIINKYGRTLLIAAAVMLAAVCVSYGADSTKTSSSGTFTDKRDGKKYKTTVIGGKTWMAQNLNYQTKKNYGSDKEYGSLYYWETAKAACPAGWHLPSRQEWSDLVTTAGGDEAGKALKSVKGWNDDSNGIDSYGFSALPGGEGGFEGVEFRGYKGCWWTSDENEEAGGSAYCRCIDRWRNPDRVSEVREVKDFAYSVRCVKN